MYNLLLSVVKRFTAVVELIWEFSKMAVYATARPKGVETEWDDNIESDEEIVPVKGSKARVAATPAVIF